MEKTNEYKEEIMPKNLFTAILLALALVSSTSVSANVISTFDSDDENWDIVEFPAGSYDSLVGSSFAPGYSGAGGNPGGTIHTTDQNANLFLFSAPSIFLGDQGAFFGGSLQYDLRFVDDNLAPGSLHPDVVLWGNGQVLVIDGFADPLTQTNTWESYAVDLTESAGWRFDSLTGSLATGPEINSVLSNLTGLYIRGDYWSGLEQTFLDNPELALAAESVPEPATIALIGLGLAGIGYRRRQSKKA